MSTFAILIFLGIATCSTSAAFLKAKPQQVVTKLVPAQANVTRGSIPKGTKSHGVDSKSFVAHSSVVHQGNASAFHGANSTAHGWGLGVVHFLFLVNDHLPHSTIWQQFFQGAPQGSWKVLIHCKDPAGCSRNGVFANNPGFYQVPTTPTWYCHDLVTAMAQLLSEALRLNAGFAGREKFVFLSDSTLPVKPFAEIHSNLLLDDNSDFCLFPADQWASSSVDGSYVQLLKHHQWVVLSRTHSEQFVRDWTPVNAQSQWKIWLKSGTWQGNAKSVHPQSFYYPATANTCTDEWAFMGTIFGALEPMSGARYLAGFGGGHIDMRSHKTQGRCRTWTYWDISWDSDAAALASQIANDFYGSQISCYPKCHARPATMSKLSASSLHALRKSPFLFARKFSENLWMPNYHDIVLS